MGHGDLQPPTESTPLNGPPKIVTGDYVGNPTDVPNLVHIPPWGFLGE